VYIQYKETGPQILSGNDNDDDDDDDHNDDNDVNKNSNSICKARMSIVQMLNMVWILTCTNCKCPIPLLLCPDKIMMFNPI
jgi:hypothetical protein